VSIVLAPDCRYRILYHGTVGGPAVTAPLSEVEIPGRSRRSPDRLVQAGQTLLCLVPAAGGEVVVVPAGRVGTVHRETAA
jgi:hypothetical protein